jgi:hypothetical protein
LAKWQLELPLQDEDVLKAQIEWLKDLIIKIGPRNVLCGYDTLRLAVFIDRGLEEVKRNVLYGKTRKPGVDDDIPF